MLCFIRIIITQNPRNLFKYNFCLVFILKYVLVLSIQPLRCITWSCCFISVSLIWLSLIVGAAVDVQFSLIPLCWHQDDELQSSCNYSGSVCCYVLYNDSKVMRIYRLFWCPKWPKKETRKNVIINNNCASKSHPSSMIWCISFGSVLAAIHP